MTEAKAPQTVLVTGGSGFIGQSICDQLAKSGHSVINLDRRKCEISGVSQYPFDLDNNQIKGILQLTKPQSVIHLADAHTLFSNHMDIDPAVCYEINVAKTINLLNQTVHAGVKNFIFGSSNTVYPNNTSGSPHNEFDPLNINDLHAHSKIVIEQALQHYHHAYPHMNFMSLRYFDVSGVDHQRKCTKYDVVDHVIATLVRGSLNGKTVDINRAPYITVNGMVKTDFVHVCDVAQAHVNVLNYMKIHRSDHCQTFNLGSGVSYDILQVIDLIQQITNCAISLTEPLPTATVEHCVADITKAEQLLGWVPKYTLTDMITHCVTRENQTQKLK
jgi:UDP-glucose 4-epimerase